MNGSNYEVPHCGASPLPIIIPLGPNIRLKIVVLNTHSLHSSLDVRDHVVQPYSTTGNIIVLFIFIFKLFEGSVEDKSLN